MANRLPFVGSGRLQEGGALATRKQDFNAHAQGNGFRHDATHVDMNPVIPSLGGTTVQEALENIRGLVTSAGSGFLSIGNVDGYVQGNYNVGDPATPTLADAFSAAFADDRVINGGIVLVLSGKYHLRETVMVPAGVSIIGEIAGTTIIGEMQEQPMFSVQKPNSSVEIVSGINVTAESNVGCVRFMNLILADNLDNELLFGEPTMISVPMIEMEVDSHLVCENVTFIGKMQSGSTPRNKTLAAITCSGAGTTGTALTLKRCYLDGLRSGLSFTPGNEEQDSLTVDGCKIRIYGTENVAAQSVVLNSFFVTSHCNLNITNNHLVGAGTYVNTVVNIVDGTGTNTKGIISGNFGTPYSVSTGKLIVDSTGSTHVCVVSNNNWGMSVDSGWYIVVGNGTGTSPVGDFNGVGAIDTILDIANSISSFSATVIVNPGTYTVGGVSGGNFANLKFIGNKHGKDYPTFTLSLPSSTTDSLGNRPLVLGNRIESIRFVSSEGRHSVRPGFNPTALTTQSAGGTLEVIDCVFVNTSLYVMDLNASSWTDSAGNRFSTRIRVENCHFLQDGTFSDTISLLLPKADQVVVDSCYFTGNGYAFSIGSNGYTSSNSSATNTVLISNVTCDLTDYTISHRNSSLQKAYILVENTVVLKLDHCRIYASRHLNADAPMSTTLTSAGTINKFIHLDADYIYIDDSTFVGVHQTFTTASVTYALPSVFIESRLSANIKNSSFYRGILPLQLSGSILTDPDFRERIIIENCYFRGDGHTALDVDLDAGNEDFWVQVIVKNCHFYTVGGSERVLHTNTTSQYGGAVQLFAGDCFVSFTDNLLHTAMSSDSFPTNNAALVIDNVGSAVNTAVISNNTFYTTSAYATGDSSESATCILCRSSVQMIQNNFISMYNTATPSSSFIGCLWIDNPGTGDYSDAIVSNNVFARRNYSGLTGDLRGGYILVTETSSIYRGRIIDNSFDSLTLNGSGTVLFYDSTNFPDNWTFERNKNQTQSKRISWASGNKGIAAGSDVGANILYGGVVASSKIYHSLGTDNVVFGYQDAPDQVQFRWSIPLQDVLPENVHITGASYRYQASAVPATAGALSARLEGVDGNDTDSTTISGTTAVTRTLTLTNDYTTKSNDNLSLVITALVDHSSTMIITITEVTVTYHW